MSQAGSGFRGALAALAGIMTFLAQAPAHAACASDAGLKFICGLVNAEDLVQLPGTPWIVASGLAEGENAGGHLYLVNARDHRVQTLLPGHVGYRQDTETFGGCPGAPDESRFSAHGLGLRVGRASQHTLYVVHHGERESVEVFKLQVGPAAPDLTWVGCVVYPAGVLGNGVAALPDDAFAASAFLATTDPKALDKLTAGQPEGGMLIWRPQTGWEDVAGAAAISADNGVAASPDGKQLFVAGTGDETVVRLSIDGTPNDVTAIGTGFHADNLRWGSDGFLYAAGARDTVQNLLACAPNQDRHCSSPFSVLRIDPVTLDAKEVVRQSGSPEFGAASTALRIGDEYWLGTPHGDRIAIAPAR
jgi:hypothetical protein